MKPGGDGVGFCWVKADKKFASRAKRKRKENSAYMCKQTLPQQAQVILTATMHDVGIHCVDLGLVALPTAALLAALPCFFRSWYMRAKTLLSISQAREWFPSLWSLKSKSPVISTWLRKESALPGVFVDFKARLLEESSLRRATVADGCLHRRELRGFNFRFVPVAQTQCPSTSRRLSLKSPCRLQLESCPAKKQSLSDVRLSECMSVRRSIDGSGSANRKGPGAKRRSLQIAAGCARRQFSVDSQLQSQPASETHVALFRPSWKRKAFLIFVFRICSRRMFIWSQWCAWCSGFRRKVATAPSFLVAKPRVPVAKCDYAPGFFEPWISKSAFFW